MARQSSMSAEAERRQRWKSTTEVLNHIGTPLQRSCQVNLRSIIDPDLYLGAIYLTREWRAMLSDESECICIGIEMHTSGINEVHSLRISSWPLNTPNESYWPTTLGRMSLVPMLDQTMESRSWSTAEQGKNFTVFQQVQNIRHK